MPAKHIEESDFQNVMERQRAWIKENFFPNLVCGLSALGFDIKEIERNWGSIIRRVGRVTKKPVFSNKLPEVYCYFDPKLDCVVLDRDELSKAADYDRVNLNVWVRDSMVHQVVHALQPEGVLEWYRSPHKKQWAGKTPPLALHEGGAEALSNMVMKNGYGKVSHHENLVLLSLLMAGPMRSNWTLRRDFVRYNLLGFKFKRRNPKDWAEVERILEEFHVLERPLLANRDPLSCAIDYVGGGHMDHVALDFLADVTYVQGLSGDIRRANAKANALFMLKARLEERTRPQ